ncbi:hypothetical protein DESC_610222 [Desulfosarcina cetonica]|nr:hypothetical protein DESC_610222 [Desulfosarcina cetonica]
MAHAARAHRCPGRRRGHPGGALEHGVGVDPLRRWRPAALFCRRGEGTGRGGDAGGLSLKGVRLSTNVRPFFNGQVNPRYFSSTLERM